MNAVKTTRQARQLDGHGSTGMSVLALARTLILLAAVALLPAAAFASEERVALVIGNDSYPGEPLRNAVNDAQQVAKILTTLGFKVIIKTNADFTSMRAAAVEFANLLDNNHAAVFYFAGHGIQYRGKNYLVPIDAKLTSETEVVFNALEATQILERMQDANVRHKFLILDACRNNPFRAIFGNNASQGLAKMQTPPGTTVAFAAQAGAVAEEGTGENGVYTKHLLRELKKPDVQAGLVFQQVSQGVQVETNGRQTPEVQSVAASKGIFFFNDTRLNALGESGASAAVSAASTRASADLETKVDLEFWSNVKDSPRADDLQAYLEQFPTGRFATLARKRMDEIKRQQAAAQSAANHAPQNAAATVKPEAATAKPIESQPIPQLAEARGIEAKPAAPSIAPEPMPATAQTPAPAKIETVDNLAMIVRNQPAPQPPAEQKFEEIFTGTIDFSDNAHYTGQYKQNGNRLKIPHGKGEYVTKTFRYIGDFKDGKKHGHGIYTWPNGDTYDGDFADDTPNGKGGFQLASGDKYEGEVVGGRISGRGIYITRESDRIEASFIDAKAYGLALYLFANGDKYEGEMVAGRLSGKGIYTTKNRDRIEGTFIEGQAQGEGICYFANNDRYEGEIKSGALTGKGKYFYGNGLRSEGEYLNGNLHGKGKFYFNDGSWFEGEFEDQLKRAKGFSYLKDGSKREAVIIDNVVKFIGG